MGRPRAQTHLTDVATAVTQRKQEGGKEVNKNPSFQSAVTHLNTVTPPTGKTQLGKGVME